MSLISLWGLQRLIWDDKLSSSMKPHFHGAHIYFSLKKPAKPQFVMPLMDQHLDVGTKQLTWQCEARSVPFPTYTWYVAKCDGINRGYLLDLVEYGF